MIGEMTLMSTDDWVDDDSVESVAATGDIDAYCNLAILIFAKIINLLADWDKEGKVQSGATSKINSLWHELQEWHRHRPRETVPLLRADTPANRPFPSILFTQSSSSKTSICSVQDACLLDH